MLLILGPDLLARPWLIAALALYGMAAAIGVIGLLMSTKPRLW